MNWRPIVGHREHIRITERPLPELVAEDLLTSGRATERSISTRAIHIRSLRAGYMEAPISYRQETLRPGCIVSYSRGSLSHDYLYAQAVLSLEDGGRMEDVWGVSPWHQENRRGRLELFP